MAQLAEHDLQAIDIVAVNLYPFAKTIGKKGTTLDEAVEQIDIGGPTMIRAAAKIHEARPDARFLVACYRQEHRHRVEKELDGTGLPVEVFAGRTAEIIHLAHACVAVSGSVGLELLYRNKPSVVVYRVRPLDLRVGRWFMTTRFISLVNLLADHEIFPEYLTDRDEAEAIAGHVLRWMNDLGAYVEVREEMAALCERVAEPGACGRAARSILDALHQQPGQRRSQAA